MLPLPSPRPSRPHYRPASISLITEGHGSPDLPVTSADPPNGRSRVTLRATERPLSWDSPTSPLPRRSDPPSRDRVNASHRGSPPRALPIAITGRPATPWRTGSHPPLQRATPQALPHRDHLGDRPPTGDWAYVSHRGPRALPSRSPADRRTLEDRVNPPWNGASPASRSPAYRPPSGRSESSGRCRAGRARAPMSPFAPIVPGQSPSLGDPSTRDRGARVGVAGHFLPGLRRTGAA